MARIQVSEKLFKVTIIMMDRFSGPEILERLYFDNREEADAAALEVNGKNTDKTVPECYTYAEVTVA